jgi:hypothetical protein
MPLIDDATRDYETISLRDPSEWVKVKSILSKGEETNIRKQLIGGSHRISATDPDAAVIGTDEVIEAQEFATLECAIVEWSFEQPVTPENLRKIPSPDVEIINAALNVLYAKRSPEAGKESSANGVQPSEVPAVSPASSSG